MNNLIRSAWAKLRSSVDLRDVFVFCGIGASATGAAQVYGPAGWITVGVALFWLGSRR